jgi:hypothetical protein
MDAKGGFEATCGLLTTGSRAGGFIHPGRAPVTLSINRDRPGTSPMLAIREACAG